MSYVGFEVKYVGGMVENCPVTSSVHYHRTICGDREVWSGGMEIWGGNQQTSHGVGGSSCLFPGRKHTQRHCGLAERRRGCFRESRQSFRGPWPGCDLSSRHTAHAILLSSAGVCDQRSVCIRVPGSIAPQGFPVKGCRNTRFWPRGAARVLYGSVFFYSMVLFWFQPSIMGEVRRTPETGVINSIPKGSEVHGGWKSLA